MTKTVLVVGLGIGSLYRSVCNQLQYKVISVDCNAELDPDYTSVELALKDLKQIDLAIITTPNYLHEQVARQIASICKVVLIEKPGVRTSSSWQQLHNDFPTTKFMMIKNNQYRTNIDYMRQCYNQSKVVQFNWINENRVPKPGSWFTNREHSFGGVSYDLIPHLLSLYTILEPDYQSTQWKSRIKEQNWQLHDLVNSDYGEVNDSGIYNVDDFAFFYGDHNDRRIEIHANWRSLEPCDIAIHFDQTVLELGLCPELAYKSMIITVLDNVNNDKFWTKQFEQDMWIHQQLENL